MSWPFPTVHHFIACRRPNPHGHPISEVTMTVVFGLRPPLGTQYPFFEIGLDVFVQLSGGSGAFELCVELYRMDTDPIMVMASPPSEVTFADRVAVYSFFRQFRMIPFDRPGLYEFRLFARFRRTAVGDAVDDQPRRLIASEPLRMEDALQRGITE